MLSPRQVLAFLAVSVWGASSFAGTPATFVGPSGNWSVAAKWSTNPTVPLDIGVNLYDVAISSFTTTYNIAGSNAINSLALSSATLNLNSGCNLSVLNGLSAGKSTLSANNASFSAAGTTNIDSSSLTTSNGGSIALPVTAYTTVQGTTWQAGGALSQVQLPNLTALAMGSSSLSLNASGGGAVNLPALTTVSSTTGTLNIQSSGTGSQVNLPLVGSTLKGLNVSISGGGTVNWGTPTTVQASSLAIDTAGTLSTAALANIDSTSVAVSNGVALSLPLVAGISTLAGTGGTLQAGANSTLNLPAATTVTNPGDIFSGLSFVASGVNAKLKMDAVTTVTNNASSITVQAQNGGAVEMTALTTVNNLGSIFGSFSVSADGTNATVSMPALATVHLVGQSDTLEASGGGYVDVHSLATVTNTGSGFEGLNLQSSGVGSIINAPQLGNAPLSKLNVSIATGGTVLWGTPTIVQASSITLDTAGTLGTASLTNIDSTNLAATNGATLGIPVGSFAATQSTTWQATGAGSIVQLAGLTGVSLAGGNLTLGAASGGVVQLPALATITPTNGTLYVQTTGAGSVVNIPLAGNVPLAHLNVSLNGGTILWGSPTTLQASSVTINTSGTIALAQLTNIDSTGFTATGGATITLPLVTAYSTVTGVGTTFQANAGSTISLPAMITMSNPGNIFNGFTFTATGAGAKLSMNAVTTVTTNAASMVFQAQSGGALEMTALASVNNLGSIFGSFDAYADGAGSRVSMPSLTVLHLFGQTDNLRATAGGYLDMHSLTSVTSTGNIFENFSVQSTGTNSIVDLSDLLSTVPFPDSLALAGNGEIMLAAVNGHVHLTFNAKFTNASGTLDVYLDGSLVTSIPSNNLNTVTGYTFDFNGPTTANPDIALVANGTNAAVTVSDYLVTPEPATLGLAALGGAISLLRRRRR